MNTQALNAQSRALLMQKLDRSGTATRLVKLHSILNIMLYWLEYITKLIVILSY